MLIGGKPLGDIGANYFEPTLITEMKKDTLPLCEETFGPLAPIYRFKTEEEAVQMANNTPYGLAAYFCTRDLGRAMRVSEALESGIIGINEGIISSEVAPSAESKNPASAAKVAATAWTNTPKSNIP